MGLLDMLQGMTNTSSAPAAGRSGMSPVTMGLLALLAYKTIKGQGPLGGVFGQGGANPGAAPASSGGGGIFDWLQNTLGGAGGASASGGAGGALVSGGLGELVSRFEQGGLGGVAQSWVGNGPNQPVAPNDLEQAVGSDTLDTLARETGMNRDQLLSRLSAELPQVVDRLTPQGRVPTAQEAGVSN